MSEDIFKTSNSFSEEITFPSLGECMDNPSIYNIEKIIRVESEKIRFLDKFIIPCKIANPAILQKRITEMVRNLGSSPASKSNTYIREDAQFNIDIMDGYSLECNKRKDFLSKELLDCLTALNECSLSSINTEYILYLIVANILAIYGDVVYKDKIDTDKSSVIDSLNGLFGIIPRTLAKSANLQSAITRFENWKEFKRKNFNHLFDSEHISPVFIIGDKGGNTAPYTIIIKDIHGQTNKIYFYDIDVKSSREKLDSILNSLYNIESVMEYSLVRDM